MFVSSHKFSVGKENPAWHGARMGSVFPGAAGTAFARGVSMRQRSVVLVDGAGRRRSPASRPGISPVARRATKGAVL